MSHQYPPNLPPQPQPGPAPRKRISTLGIFITVIVALFAWVGGCGSAMIMTAADEPSNVAASEPATSTEPTADPTTSEAEEPTEAETTTRPPKPTAPRVLLKASGSGIEKTRRFTVTEDEAKIRYRFDCSSFGYEGNFQIYLYSGGSMIDVAANDLAMQGKNTTYIDGAGTYRMQVNSTCEWHLRVTQ